ncbi:MAG: nucleotide sugar dehydrogenase [Alicyclobacillus sp.]|nr:nucleotide sugar dehydrogenase [Alicyclobacillus sp.]
MLSEELNAAARLKQKISTRSARVAVIGAGYVGLTLAVQLAKTGYNVWAIDDNKMRIELIRKGISYIEDVSTEELTKFVGEGQVTGTVDTSVLAEADVVIICVPTPLTVNREPDVSYIVSATEQVACYLHPGQLVVLESTTYPGTTEEVILPRLEATGLKVGVDYFLANSPERVDFGNKNNTRWNVPKVVGGVTPHCSELAVSFFETAVNVVPVSSAKIAELVKVYENTYRAVNIALVNEIALLCDRMGINVWEMLDAAFTKPYGIQAFYPGPGVGGHCIPIDPFYLAWKAREFDFPVKFIELAGEINLRMPYFVLEKVVRALGNLGKPAHGSNVLVLGVAYKKDISDYRESPALKIIKLLYRAGANVSYHDPLVPRIHFHSSDFGTLDSVELTDEMWSVIDAVVITTDHSNVDYEEIVRRAPVVIDTRNATKLVSENRDKIVLL